MSINRVLFPEGNRSFPGKRWMRIVLRSLHLCGACGVVGGVFFDAPVAQLAYFYMATMLSGLCLALIDVFTNGIWLKRPEWNDAGRYRENDR